MRRADKAKIAALAGELRALYEQHGGLDPAVVVKWAKAHPSSVLHGRFEWDDTKAAHQFRLWQARELITEVTVVYPDGKERQVYVSPVETRGKGGYVAMADVMSDKQRRESFLAQALAEYQRVGEKYSDLEELAGIRASVARAAHARRPRQRGRQARAA